MSMSQNKTSYPAKSNFTVAESFWKKKQQEKIDSAKQFQDNLKKDMDYVKTLNSWEKKFLPEIK